MNIVPNIPIHLTIRSHPCTLPVVRTATATLCELVGFPNDLTGQIVLSVDEALANIIRHAYRGADDRVIDLDLQAFDRDGQEGVEIRLRDYGPKMDPDHLKPVEHDITQPGGLGLRIMANCMDRIAYESADGEGMVLTMTKTLTPQDKERTHMTYDTSHNPIKEVQRTDGAVIVQAAGDIDLSRSQIFQDALLELAEDDPSALIIDLSGVPYMDSSGVASLVKVLSRVRAKGLSLSLVGLNDRVRSIFEITRLDSVFCIYNTPEEALSEA